MTPNAIWRKSSKNGIKNQTHKKWNQNQWPSSYHSSSAGRSFMPNALWPATSDQSRRNSFWTSIRRYSTYQGSPTILRPQLTRSSISWWVSSLGSPSRRPSVAGSHFWGEFVVWSVNFAVFNEHCSQRLNFGQCSMDIMPCSCKQPY